MPAEGRLFCFSYRLEAGRRAQSGPATLAIGRMHLESVITRESLDALYCVVHFGAADFRCGLVPSPGPDADAELVRALLSDLDRDLVRAAPARGRSRFPGRDYSLSDLFLDERRQVADVLLEGTLRRYEDDYLRVFEDNRRLMEFLREIDSPVPGAAAGGGGRDAHAPLLDVTERTRSGAVNLDEAERALLGRVELARRLGAHFDVAPFGARSRRSWARARALVAGQAASRAPSSSSVSSTSPRGRAVDRFWEPRTASGNGRGREAHARLGEDRRPRPAALVRRAHPPRARRLRAAPERGGPPSLASTRARSAPASARAGSATYVRDHIGPCPPHIVRRDAVASRAIGSL